MGSEGQGEQLLKTDQDNGLILRDGYQPPADLPPSANAFLRHWACSATRHALAASCSTTRPGGAPRKDFAATLREWVWQPGGDNLMHLAIFMDAHAVAGDAALLAQVATACTSWRPTTMRCWGASPPPSMRSRPMRVGSASCFAGRNATTAAPEKAGLFPLVHGVRTWRWRTRSDPRPPLRAYRRWSAWGHCRRAKARIWPRRCTCSWRSS